jgi:hypothetical protein
VGGVMLHFQIDTDYEIMMLPEADYDIQELLEWYLYETPDCVADEVADWADAQGHRCVFSAEQAFFSGIRASRLLVEFPDADAAFHFRMRFSHPLAQNTDWKHTDDHNYIV